MALQPPRPDIKFPTHLLSISTRATESKVRGLKACRGVVELPVLCPFSLKLYYGLLSPPPQKLVTKLPTFEIKGSSISARPPIACRAYHFTRASSSVCVNLWSPTIYCPVHTTRDVDLLDFGTSGGTKSGVAKRNSSPMIQSGLNPSTCTFHSHAPSRKSLIWTAIDQPFSGSLISDMYPPTIFVNVPSDPCRSIPA